MPSMAYFQARRKSLIKNSFDHELTVQFVFEKCILITVFRSK